MERNVVSTVAFCGGGIAILGGFTMLQYRLGKFTPLPGEGRRNAVGFLLVFSLLLVLFVAVPIVGRLLGLDWGMVIMLVAGAFLAYSLLTSSRREKRMAELAAKRSPDEQAEVDKRKAFNRSGQGRLVLLTGLLSLGAWAYLTLGLAGAFLSNP